MQKLRKQNCLEKISKVLTSPKYNIQSLDYPEVRHFLYKSKSTAQFTCPIYTEPYVKNRFIVVPNSSGRLRPCWPDPKTYDFNRTWPENSIELRCEIDLQTLNFLTSKKKKDSLINILAVQRHEPYLPYV